MGASENVTAVLAGNYNVNKKLYDEYINEAQKHMNRILNRAVWYSLLVVPIIMVGVFFNLFKSITYGGCLLVGLLISGMALFHTIILRKDNTNPILKYLILLSMEVVIITMAHFHMGIYMTFFLVPLASLFYLDKKTYYFSCVIAYIGLFICNYMIMNYSVMDRTDTTPMRWFRGMMVGYTIEFVAMFMVGYVLCGIIINHVHASCSNKVTSKLQAYETSINHAMQVALTKEHPEQSIYELISYLGNMLKADRVYIFEDRKKENVTDNTYEWCKEGVESAKEKLQGVNKRIIDWWYEAFNNHSNVVIKNTDEYRMTNPAAYDIMASQNIHSILVTPIFIRGEVVGFFGADNPPVEDMDEMSMFFEMIGTFMSSLIMMRNSFMQTEEDAQLDLMTGIRNRGSGEEKIREFVKNKTVGMFILLDVDSFKSINDNYGHGVGDQVLIKIADTLKNSFRDQDLIMRLGGDEFAVFARGIMDERTGRGCIQRFFDGLGRVNIPLLRDRKIEVSVGASLLSTDDNIDFENLYKATDEKLYRSKQISGCFVTF